MTLKVLRNHIQDNSIFTMTNIDVSVVIPIYNGEKWIDKCFDAILNQSALSKINIEICVCNDASNDKTGLLLEEWQKKFEEISIVLKIYKNERGKPGGVGYGKNRAVDISCGTYLCFQDIVSILIVKI